MRATKTRDGVRVRAIAGTNVVVLGMSATKEARKGLLGFAIRRTDVTEGEQYWLRGMKTFEEVVPYQQPGFTYSLLEHPVQTFRWADYTAKAGHEYVYDVVPLRGKPKFLVEGKWVTVEVASEREGDPGEVHDVYFNRGVAASQAYSRRFGDNAPSELEGAQQKAAYAWLSRGLEEALIAFLGQAKSSSYALRAAVYEFNHDPVVKAFKDASKRGADVEIVYDARDDHPQASTLAALERHSMKSLATPRKQGSAISHNKFVVLLKQGKPIAVWTGSTNLTASGLYGQSNVGHVVRDPKIAADFLAYWEELKKDPDYDTLRDWSAALTPDPDGPPAKGITPVFSPRHGMHMLEWYAERFGKAQKSGHLTAAFGVHDLLEVAIGKQKAHLRYVLMERRDEDQSVWTKDKDVLVAVGNKIRGDALYGWLSEQTHFGTHVHYVHDKFMLIDPLSNDPVVITGSANFSANSTRYNDENMLVIRGDKRVADIYVGEFMRLFSHHYFREIIAKQQGAEVPRVKTLYLDPTDKWTSRYYKPHSVKLKERLLYSGATS